MAQKQVIALIRESTEKQEIESQKAELTNYIKQDGVKAENIIIVGDKGASARKLDNAYRKNMNTVFELIDGGNIAAVYAWAIDRIGRDAVTLFTFKNKLVKNGIQLIIKNPSLRLLDDDGSVNHGTELAFSLFATMAEQEMDAKFARFERAKRRNAEQGRYNGGIIHFGYTVNEDGKVVVNDEEAELVKLIYELYASGEYSTTTLTKELQSRGYTVRGKAVSLHFITNMLKSTAFVGHTIYNKHEVIDGKKTGKILYTQKRTYDRIISNELFETVKQRLTANHKGDITRQSKHTYLASKLIVCPECGRHWFASNRSYTCIGHKHHGKGLQGYETCPNGDSIAVEWVDIAAWSVAKSCEMDYIYNFTEDKAEQAQKQIEVNNQKIETLKERINGMDARRQRINDQYELDDKMTKQDYETKLAKVKSDTAEYHAQIIALEEDNKKLNEIAQFDQEGTLIRLGSLPISGIYEDVENAYRITHKYIKQITVEPFEFNGKTQKMITIATVIGDVRRLLYIAKSKVKKDGHIYKLFYQSGDDFLPLYATKDYVPPFVQD